MAELLSILRYHIVLIAMAATLVFGWLLTGAYAWAAAGVVGLDWLLINLLNRVTDVAEDRANAIPGTERVARARRAFLAFSFAVMAGSFALTHALMPALTPLRASVQAIGLGYSYRLVPTPRGLRRFKDIYFLKNFMSAVLFVLTTILYPIALAGWQPAAGWAPVVALAAFFVPFELTYEVLYDLRDLDGDRRLAIPTFPVVHGPERARRIIDGLLAAAAMALAVALGAGAVGLREGLMLAAPAVQVVLYRRLLRGGLRPVHCIALTHAGTAMLLLFLAGTATWRAAGLPENVFLR